MSRFDPLPPDLAALDQQLAALPKFEPSPELRQRVSDSMEQILQRETGLSWGWFAAAAAAVLLLLGNFSMSAAAHTYSKLSSDRPAAVGSHSVDQLQALLPELTRQEASRHVVLLDAARRIMPSGKLPSQWHSKTFQVDTIESE